MFSFFSEMQTVLWEGTRWKTIGLGDLLEPKQVNIRFSSLNVVVLVVRVVFV